VSSTALNFISRTIKKKVDNFTASPEFFTNLGQTRQATLFNLFPLDLWYRTTPSAQSRCSNHDQPTLLSFLGKVPHFRILHLPRTASHH
jgi:hypothetical protein